MTLAFLETNVLLFLMVEASNFAVGITLNQMFIEVLETLGFFSKLTVSDQHYSTFERELFVLHAAIKHLRI